MPFNRRILRRSRMGLKDTSGLRQRRSEWRGKNGDNTIRNPFPLDLRYGWCRWRAAWFLLFITIHAALTASHSASSASIPTRYARHERHMAPPTETGRRPLSDPVLLSRVDNAVAAPCLAPTDRCAPSGDVRPCSLSTSVGRRWLASLYRQPSGICACASYQLTPTTGWLGKIEARITPITWLRSARNIISFADLLLSSNGAIYQYSRRHP